MAKQTAPSDTPEPSPASEGYTVLARRYRPQTFRELVGQDAVARVLANAIKSNRVAHAYLFTGARGVGKTSTARILAKALNCEKGPTDDPCGVCATCRSITEGQSVDVIEIDGASNRNIDDIRDIRSNIQYRPSRCRYKIYIIDEVHALYHQAFPALLKTLEEPPPHVKFIFATTDVQKVPITILSRCQRFDFPGIPVEQIAGRLREIVAREGLPADDEALDLIARRAAGSLRDAQSLLDQLLSFGAERLTTDQVHHLFGTASEERILALAGAILGQDPARALALLDEAAREGLLLGELVEQLIAYWRDLMVLHCAGAQPGALSLSARHRQALAQQAAALNIDTILAGLDVLAATRERLRGSNHARTLVEMALVRLGRLGDLVPLAQLARLLSQPGAASAVPTPPSDRTPARAAVPEPVKKKPLTPAVDRLPENGPLDLTPATLQAAWAQTLQGIGVLLASEFGKAESVAIFGPKTLVIRFPAAYNQSREYCQRTASVEKVQEVLRKLTGSEWLLRIESAPLPDGEAAPEPPPESSSPAPRPRRSPKEEVAREPLVQRALDVLGAQVVRVDEGFGVRKSQDTEPAADAPAEEEL